MIKTKIDNRDFEHVHIDTYSMLTGESNDEMMRENDREDADTEGRDYDENRDIDYDMNAIREALAKESIGYLENELENNELDGLITDIKFLNTGHPKFYNYTTDWYVAEYMIDEDKMNEYIQKHLEAVQAKLETYSKQYDENLVDNKYHAGVCHLIDHLIDREDYNMHMWEIESEVYYENMQWSDEKEANNNKK